MFQIASMSIQTSDPIPDNITNFLSPFCSGLENSVLKAYLKNQMKLTNHRNGRNRNPTKMREEMTLNIEFKGDKLTIEVCTTKIEPFLIWHLA